MSVFLISWFGQLISTFGSGLTRFAPGVYYIHQPTSSVTKLSLAVLVASLPGILLASIARVIADRRCKHQPPSGKRQLARSPVY